MRERYPVQYRSSEHSWPERYIHKYYLSPDLKRIIFPVDIGAIESLQENADRLAGDNPDITIYYKDLGLEKRVSGEVSRQVLEACNAYRFDCRAELTPEEVRAALNLNDWLAEWEKKLRDDCIRLNKEMERRLRGNDSFLTDYEIEMEIDFYLRDDDPFYDNDDTNSHDWDIDTSLMCKMECRCGKITAEEVTAPDYRGLGDDKDHKEARHSSNPVYQVRHCFLFHELTSHLYVPLKHLSRIGRVFTDIRVWHQNGTMVDLQGEKIVAQKDEPFIANLRMELRQNSCHS